MQCEMVVNWTCDENGEPDQEIECGKPAVFVYSGSVLTCQDCHDTMVTANPVASKEFVEAR